MQVFESSLKTVPFMGLLGRHFGSPKPDTTKEKNRLISYVKQNS